MNSTMIVDSFALRAAGAVLILLLAWRLWRFTITPMLYPDQPKELPYWIPILGHAFSFFKSFNNAIEMGIKHFHPDRAPFAMTIGGETIYVATAAEDINAVWKNTKQISMIPISEGMYKNVGLSEKSFKEMFELHPNAEYNQGNAKPLTPTQMVMELHHRQLVAGPGIDALMKDKIIASMFKGLDFTHKRHHPAVIRHFGHSVEVSLLRLCIELWIADDTEAYFGPMMLSIVPKLPMAFMDWELCNWKFVFGLPPILAGDMVETKNTITSAFARYYGLPKKERPGASMFVEELESMLREIGLTEDEMGKFTLLHYWALAGNACKLAFWLMAHLVRNPALMEQVRREVQPAVKAEGIVDEGYLSLQCPRLNSLGDEMLRLTVSSPLGRGIMEDTVVGGKKLKAGSKITLPLSAMHNDEAVWNSPSEMQPNRFNDNPNLAKSKSYRPWGGGSTLCPGRFLARRSVNVFVAILLTRYEVEGVPGTFPQPDMSRPSPGIASVIPGQDVKLRCVKRKWNRGGWSGLTSPIGSPTSG